MASSSSRSSPLASVQGSWIRLEVLFVCARSHYMPSFFRSLLARRWLEKSMGRGYNRGAYIKVDE